MSSNATEATGSHGTVHGPEAEGHGSAWFYVWIGLILAVVTGVEVAIFYIEAFEAVEAPLLVLLSSSKVVLVVMFFMHMKMEPRAVTWVFIAGAVLATFMVSALFVLYHVLPGFGG